MSAGHRASRSVSTRPGQTVLTDADPRRGLGDGGLEYRRDRHRHGRVRHRPPAGDVGRSCAGQLRGCRQAEGGWDAPGNVFLKSALFAAASAAVRTKGSYYRDKYNRLCARRGRLRAIMAIAHKLLIAAFHMLSTGEAFRDLGESYLDQVARKRSTTRLVQRLSNLGYDFMLVPKAA